MNKNRYYIVDFDSTFIRCEALELLADICLADNPGKRGLIERIKSITALGMEGKLSFGESLHMRLSLIRPHRLHVEKLAGLLMDRISPSILVNRKFFKTNKGKVYIVSGGFCEFIEPVVAPFDIERNFVMANSFTFAADGSFAGYDENSPLCNARGKAITVKALGLQGEVTVIGDGYTDYEIRKEGAAHRFIAYTENAVRPQITKLADMVAESFSKVSGDNG